MNKSKFLFFLFIAGLVAFTSCKKDDESNNDIDCSTVTYSTTIAPILQNSCTTAGCHNAGSPNGSYITYADLETVAKDGTMEQRVLIDMTMPKAGAPLTQTQLDQFQCWLDAGAPDN